MAKIDILFPFILSFEGGFVNDPNDLGGATNKGITLNTYKFYCKQQGRAEPTVDDLKNITESEVKAIMKKNYWDKWKADDIKDQSVANAVVDWLWNSGAAGIKEPQRLLSVSADGIVGPKTIAALNSCPNQEELFNEIQKARVNYLNRICDSRPANKKFLNGWLRRVESIHYGSLDLNTNPKKKISF